MRWSFQLGRVKGIDIKVHATFFLIIIWGALRYGNANNVSGLIYGAVLTMLIFVIVLLHELGHGLAALRFGIKVRDITLLPIGGLARLEGMPKKPFQEFVVAVAGPAVNVVLIVLIFPLLWWATDGNLLNIFRLYGSAPGWLDMVRFLFWVNVSLLVFNMIPAFPLDGGRVLRSLLAMWLGNPKATRIAVRVGQGFAFLLGAYGIFTGNFFMAMIAIFIFTAGGAEGKSAAMQNALDGISIRQVVSGVDTVLSPNLTVMETASMTLHSPRTNFPVLLGDTLVGVILRPDIRYALERGKNFAAIAEVMRRDIPSLDMDNSLAEAQDHLLRSSSPVAAVYEDSCFRGLIGFDDIQRAYQLCGATKP